MTAVPNYRAYKLNPAGKIVSGDWIEAIDDGAARELARKFCDEITPMVELGRGARLVERLNCEAD